MVKPVLRRVHIAANTSSSTEAFARRTNEISRFISGIGRQNSELERSIPDGMRLSLIKTHPTSSERRLEGRISRYTFSLEETLRTRNPNNIYRMSGSIEELRSNFEPLIEEISGIVREADVVLLGGTYFVPWCVLQAARRERKPAVLCYAGILSMEITHLPHEMQRTLRLMEQDFYDPNIFYIFPSQLTRKTVQEIFRRPLESSEVVYNGVPPEFLAIEGPSRKVTQVAFVGRNTPVKNPEFLLRLKSALDSMHRDYVVKMVTGIDPQNRLIKELKRAGVVVLEPLGTDELARFYASTAMVISPSRFETFGNVPLEALSTGTPALVSSNMGVSEVFSSLGMNELVTDFGDAREVAGRIEEAVERGESVPESVRRKIRAELSWPRVIRRYLDICLDHSGLAAAP
jgi:glycosyltransferase involved in cell wall biosynthesis